MYDTGSETARLQVFASETGLNLLGSAKVSFMDGTHSTSPAQFAQLFYIRVPVGESYGTAAYALLPGKQKNHFKECVTAIMDACLR
ncbi:hypothetical protein DPMN_030074 [Dreissena polymorpha]|uniref:Uncharacterized protein n=1 Tax=Dreissena polymorpha TaxID=45954 RepID=A0A9D4LZ99_DREPO|nr:hypothetical protein DPMN_030074 [Dreissena polymorpha]